MAMTNQAGSDEAALRDALREVIDPEIGINIVDLGLVYRIALSDRSVLVEMTMTSAACPLGEMIVEEVKEVLGRRLPGIEQEVRLVWDPPWDPAMMSERARRTLE